MRLITILLFTSVVVAVIDAKAVRTNEEAEQVVANDNPNSTQNVDSNPDPRERESQQDDKE